MQDEEDDVIIGYWNYRMVEADGYLHLREIYYDADGSIRFWTQEPAAPHGDDIEDISGALMLMLQATKRPILRLVDNTFVEVTNDSQ